MSANNQDKLKKQLKELLKLQENKYCVGFLADVRVAGGDVELTLGETN